MLGLAAAGLLSLPPLIAATFRCSKVHGECWARPRVCAMIAWPLGIFMISTKDGERSIHILKLDGFDKTTHRFLGGERLLGSRQMKSPARERIMLPFGLSFHDGGGSATPPPDSKVRFREGYKPKAPHAPACAESGF